MQGNILLLYLRVFIFYTFFFVLNTLEQNQSQFSVWLLLDIPTNFFQFFFLNLISRICAIGMHIDHIRIGLRII